METFKPKYQPTFSLVFGYLPNIERKRSHEFKNLKRKFSLILETYNPEVGDMYFDFKMFNCLLNLISRNFSFDKINFIQDKINEFVFHDLNSFFEELRNKFYLEIENEVPFSQIIFAEKESPTLIVIPEFYSSIGGPYPYHDSITFTFFYNTMNTDEFLEELKKTAQSNNYDIRAILNGFENPRMSIFQRIKDLLF